MNLLAIIIGLIVTYIVWKIVKAIDDIQNRKFKTTTNSIKETELIYSERTPKEFDPCGAYNRRSITHFENI